MFCGLLNGWTCLMVIIGLIQYGSADGETVYKMCVPHKFYTDCLELLKNQSKVGLRMECVSGRDRIDCLDMINNKKADLLASDPEDMYIAYHTKNQHFRVVSEFRTKVEENAEFRYEGVILVKKSSQVRNLKELRGKKSCHTGFGRNVGYKIPITKLKNQNILKVSLDPTISAAERELKALSEFFAESCLVGTYSPDPTINENLKKKYSNLCALCEKPKQCNYPDIYSGYEGAIRCLDKGQGEVAFTKTSFIKKYFGLTGSDTTAQGDPSEFEYLCEDGSRKPITGPACSWAQRPWKGYISNSDTVKDATKLRNLDDQLKGFFDNGLELAKKRNAEVLLIEPGHVLHEKPIDVKPKEYLERAGYKDVIERDGSITHKIKLCVSNPIEAEKCDVLRRAAFSRDIRPDFECVMDENCMVAVKDKKADAVILTSKSTIQAKNNDLKSILYEILSPNDVYVAVVDSTITSDSIQSIPLKFDKNDNRALLAARLLNKNRNQNVCDELPEVSSSKISIVHASKLKEFTANKKLLCLDSTTKPLTDFATCNVEAFYGNAVYVRNGLSQMETDSFIHSFVLLSTKFGHQGKLEDVFEIFGEFKTGQPNVLFHDYTEQLLPKPVILNSMTAELYNQLTCST